MMGVDTNVLARLFVNDDERQRELALGFFAKRDASDPTFVSTVVVAEFAWLLERTYDYSRARIIEALSAILDSPDFVFERRDLVEAAVGSPTPNKATVADMLIAGIAGANGCPATMTFDRDAARYVPGMELLK